MYMMHEFLSNSTSHGLVYIHSAKSRAVKVAWILIVALGFGFAAYLIGNSYSEWIESPVSTVVTTKPISELEFPDVTVCPPRGSNTVLNLIMERVQDDWKWDLRDHLLRKIRPIYYEQPKSFANNMAEMMNIQILSDLQSGRIHVPERTENLIHYQVNVTTMENLTIQAEEGTIWKYSWQEEKLQLYRKRGKMAFAEAEASCVSLGGHLASIQSKEENTELLKMAEQQRVWVWLEGSDQEERGKWVWSDEKEWNFTDWAFGEPNNESQSRCVRTIGVGWYATPCTGEHLYPLCQVEPRSTNGKLQIDLSEKQRTKFHIWLDYNSSDPHYFENPSLKINISWAGRQETTERQTSIELGDRRLELHYFFQSVSWEEAEEICQEKGGHLASIASKKEQEELVDLVGNKFFWLGGSDTKKEGKWAWTDRTPWKVEYWNQSEPNGRGGENCLATLEGVWTDRVCGRDLDGFVCRLPTTMSNFWKFARLLYQSKWDEKSTDFFDSTFYSKLRRNRFSHDRCLTPAEELGVIELTRRELKITESAMPSTSVSDQKFSTLLAAFSILHFCPPPNIMEAVQLGFFYYELLSRHHMRTVTFAAINNILRRKGGVIYNRYLFHDFINELDKIYNLTIGPSLLALASKSQLKDLEKENYPFLEDFKSCLQAGKCTARLDILEDLASKEI